MANMNLVFDWFT